MTDQKNLLLAIICSVIILVVWQIIYVNPRIEEAQRQQELERQKQEQLSLNQPTNNNNVAPSDLSSEALPLSSSVQPIDRSLVLEKVTRVPISNGKLNGSISLRGARIDDLILSEYKQENTENSDNVVLLSPSGSKQVYFAEFGWLGANTSVQTPNAQTVWHTKDSELTPTSPVTLSWDNNAGLKFYISISVDEHYLFTIRHSVENYGNTSASLQHYGIINRARSLDTQSFYILHEGALGVFDNQLHESTYSDLKDDKKLQFKNTNGWLGVTDKYWLTALIPSQNDSFDTNFTYYHRNNQDRYKVDFLEQMQNIDAGENISGVSHFFAGAKKVKLLDQYGQKLDIELFDRAVDFGMLYFITKPIFKLLTYFYDTLGNFGLAILMLTVLIKLVLFPLANKSYISMHKMKKVQPQMLEIKERFTNDKMQMNKELQELFKREKVNPMSGCMPLLLQLPIFFALYKVLFVTIEMRHAPFYGWIDDLSAKDPTTLFNLFGLLPWAPPSFLIIGAWPIIMGITMYLQQKMNPTPTDPVQAQVMKMLPFIFVFLFASFPAGLVIYWAWNNILSILQQWVITRKLS